MSLLKYYRMSRTLSEAAGVYFEREQKGALDDPGDILRFTSFLAYWFASLDTLREGWQSLRLYDASVDQQLTSEHVLVLTQYRHTVYHFQQNMDQARIAAFERSLEHVGWAMSLGEAFQEFFDPHLEAIQVERIRPWLFASERTG